MKKFKLRSNDVVRIIAGKYKGKEGPVLSINKSKMRVVVKGLTVLKHQKPTQNGNDGGIKEIDASVHISNVALINPKNKKEITKIGFMIKPDGKKVRVARSTNTEIDK